MNTDLIGTIKDFTPIILGVMGVLGGSYGYFYYKSTKPKSVAEAQKLNAEVVVTFADGWQKYAEKIEARMTDMEKRYEKTIQIKDAEIMELKRRVKDLENQIDKYRIKEGKIDEVKQNLHISVENELDTIKQKKEYE